MELKKTIYTNYAFKENEREKGKINGEILAELKKRYRVKVVSQGTMPRNPEDYDLIIERKPCYHHSECHIRKNETALTEIEIALLCDECYRLVYGYSKKPNFYYIFED